MYEECGACSHVGRRSWLREAAARGLRAGHDRDLVGVVVQARTQERGLPRVSLEAVSTLRAWMRPGHRAGDFRDTITLSGSVGAVVLNEDLAV